MSNEVGAAIGAAAEAIQRWYSRPDNQRRLKSEEFTPPPPTERWLMSKLSNTGPVRMSTLAQWQRVDRSTMTSQIKRLEDLEYVNRTPDPSDGRASLVELTDNGRECYLRLKSVMATTFNDLIGDWPAPERTEFARLLQKFAATLDDPPPED